MEAWRDGPWEANIYREASASPLLDAAYLLWGNRLRLNSVEHVEDGPSFPPLPQEEDVMKVVPEIIRRVRVSEAYEKENLEKSQTMKRIRRCQPNSTPPECLISLRSAIRMALDLQRHFSELFKKKAGSDFECAAMAFGMMKAENPGFSDSSYGQAYDDLKRGLY